MQVNLSTPLTKIRKFQKKKKEALNRLNLFTLLDLFLYFPVRYDDFSNITDIAHLALDQKQTIQGIIQTIENRRTLRRKMVITEALVSDSTGLIKVIWFNQPYLKNFLRTGSYITLNGKVEYSFRGRQMVSPVYEKCKKNCIHTNRIVPVYSETEGISSKWLRFFINPLLRFANQIEDFLPKEILKTQNLVDLPEAIREIHFPKTSQKLEAAKARLAFDELFLIQLDAQNKKYTWQKNKAKPFKFYQKLIAKFVKTLPFKLTNAQRVAAWEILKDLEKENPMNRLLEGDVGSGKTVVAAIGALEIVWSGAQVALMAPTEILAKQHFNTFSRLLADFNVKIGLSTRTDSVVNAKLKTKNAKPQFKTQNLNSLHTKHKELLELIKRGQVDIMIGTHALIQEDIKFKNLALAIIDEQHRFGVKQRAELQKMNAKKFTPHLLSMTATPIPRTLALGLYGNLDLSIINEMPRGRKKIITKLVAPKNREKAYEFIRQQVKGGRQVFVICPRIENQNHEITKAQKQKNNYQNMLLWSDVKAVTDEYEKLSKKVFPDLTIGLLHGKLKKEEKEKTMRDFAGGKIDILVSTSVVEVGIDIKNATIMMIEGAEKFGLAQLHQFRGRVGRAEHQSFCFLFTDSSSINTHQRLSTLVDLHDGFKLAEKDLEFRGPGEIYGTRQSGIPDLKMASLSDFVTLKKARDEAQKLIQKDPELKSYPKLKNELQKFKETVHFE
jgi:ATP-dependent DNA helicase RecG